MPVKIKPAPFQFRADGGADVAFARRQFGRFRPPADMHVGARLARRRHPVDGAGEFAVHQDDALVALAHLGKIALHDHRLAIELGEHLQQRAQILVIRPDAEHAGAAIAVERLEDDVLVLVAEVADLARGPR